MPANGRIILLNGAPRSGKSSIAAAIAESFEGVWVTFGVDAAMAMTPARLQPGIGLRPGGERPDLEPELARLYVGVFDAIAAFSRDGVNVVSDFGIHDGYSQPLGIWDVMERRLAGLPLLKVGVLCPIEVIMSRRNADPRGLYVAGEGVPAPVQRWQDQVHAGRRYDLVVDTGGMSPEDCAAIIRAHEVATG